MRIDGAQQQDAAHRDSAQGVGFGARLDVVGVSFLEGFFPRLAEGGIDEGFHQAVVSGLLFFVRCPEVAQDLRPTGGRTVGGPHAEKGEVSRCRQDVPGGVLENAVAIEKDAEVFVGKYSAVPGGEVFALRDQTGAMRTKVANAVRVGLSFFV